MSGRWPNRRSVLAAPIRRPRAMILVLGVVFAPVGGIASLVTAGIGEAISTVALIGGVCLAALLLAADHRPPATDHHRPIHADENAENSTHSTTTEED